MHTAILILELIELTFYMSQKLIIAIMGLVILGGGGAWYYQTNMAGTDNSIGSKTSSRETSDEKNGLVDAFKDGASNFADVLKGGAAQECSFSGTDPETKEYSEGTVFIDGESFRLKAETEHSGTKETINLIQHEKVMYMWSDGEAMPGIKIDMSMFEGMEETEKPESPLDWLKDPEAGVKYKCRGWSSRSDSFEPPEDIEFMDMFGGMGQMFGDMMREGVEEEGGY